MSDSSPDSTGAHGGVKKIGDQETCGVRVEGGFMRRFVTPGRDIVLHLDGWPEPVRLPYSPEIHGACPEFRAPELMAWFKEKRLLHWGKGEPPEFTVEALKEENHFFIRPLG